LKAADLVKNGMRSFRWISPSVLGAASLAILAGVPLPAAPEVAAPSVGAPVKSVQELSKITLRGFGEVSGRYSLFGEGSILEITCENEEKAKLTQAKYLSDAQLLPGVMAASSESVSGALEVQNQGWVAAITSGTKVFLLASSSADGLEKLAVHALGGAVPTSASKPEVAVPMWLDKWDKYGFRESDYDNVRMFMPPKSDRITFDHFSSFEWLRDKAKMGLAIDPYIGHQDFAEGITSEPFSSWEENTALELNLPFNLRSMSPKVDATPMWFANRHLEAMQQKAPYYVGNFYTPVPDPGWGNNSRTLAWSSGDAGDELLAEIQQTIRRAIHYPNLLGYNYPDQEVQHGYHDLLVEWGPVADASYQQHLKQKYGALTNLSQRWCGSAGKLKSWDEVRVPELAEFEGWSSDAIEIDGLWKVKRLADKEEPPVDWMKPECADTDWEGVRTPGDWMMFGGYQKGKPAVFRNHFTLSAEWLKNHPRQWLYVWDLNSWKSEIALSVNGQEVVRDKGWPYVPHWVALDVTGKLATGSNQLALLLPEGFIGYRVYVSGHAPQQYPYLGREANARWVDFMDWRTACRSERIRRDMDAIRQIDPDKSICIDAPHNLLDEAREAAIDMGGVLHDTGGMMGSWNIKEVMLDQGAGLPYSVEGGNGPRSPEEFQDMIGNFITEGVQSVDNVTPAISEMFYNEAIRQCVEENVPLTQMIGKYHEPPAQVAYFLSSREVEMLAYPWKPDASKVISMGYFGWYCALEYPAAGVMESDFLKDRAEKFSVIIDTNTQIMDEKTVDGIERYVKNGGVFVTLGQTGRHTETEAEAWPINRLTGYKVTAIDSRLPDGAEHLHPGGLDDPLADNGIFQIKHWQDNPASAHDVNYANGLSLQKIAPECRDLIKWKDGATAVGIRPLGKGYILDMGVVFGRNGASFLMKKLLEDIVLWRGVKERTPAQIYPAVIADPASMPKDLNLVPGSVYILSAMGMAFQKDYDHNFDGSPWAYKNVIFRHFQSNNGLYDVWALYNTSKTESRTQDITFRDGLNPAFGFDVKAGRQVAITNDGGIPKLKDIELKPRETKIFLTPRNTLLQAGLDWFDLQRDWWRTSYTPGKPFPPVPHKLTVDLYDNWAFLPLTDKNSGDVAALAGPQTDDQAWEHRPLGIWTTPKNQSIRHGLLRRWIDIPKSWNKGTVQFWLSAWYLNVFYDGGQVYLDGAKLPPTSSFLGVDMTDIFKPGSRHLIALEVQSKGQMTGVAGDCWLYYTPDPLARTSLLGEWSSSIDMIHYDNKVTLPGILTGKSVRRNDVMLDAAQKGKTVLLYVDSGSRIHGALVNGHWVCRFHHCIGPYLELNITPFVKFGQPNEIELTQYDPNPSVQTRALEIRYYNPEEYP
jgi:hypothetical protein